MLLEYIFLCKKDDVGVLYQCFPSRSVHPTSERGAAPLDEDRLMAILCV